MEGTILVFTNRPMAKLVSSKSEFGLNFFLANPISQMGQEIQFVINPFLKHFFFRRSLVTQTDFTNILKHYKSSNML